MSSFRTLALIAGAAALWPLSGCRTELHPTMGGEAAQPSHLEVTDGPVPFRLSTLDNGMRVISVEDRSAPVAEVQVWYHVGSKDEDPNRQGFAHMFEHMMFRGTLATAPNEHSDTITSFGGYDNASTRHDWTDYVQTIPSNQLDTVLWLEAERMAFLKVEDEGFQTERRVVEEERRMRLEQPYGDVLEKLSAEVFRKHPYRWSPIGNIPMLRAATSADLQAFWEKYYIPNNATLIVVGDVSHDHVHSAAERYFGWIPRGPEPPRVTVREDEPVGPRKIDIKVDNGPVPIVIEGYLLPGQGHPDMLALEVLFQILGGGESSRMYRKIVLEEDEGVAALAGTFPFEQYALGGGVAVLPPFGGNRDAARKILSAEIERVKAEPVSQKELDKARNQMLRGAVEERGSVTALAEALGNASVIDRNLPGINEDLERLRALTPADLQAVAQRYLVADNRMDITLEPSLGGMLMNSLLKPRAEEENAPVAKSPEGAKYGMGKPGLERPESFGTKKPTAPLLAPKVSPKPAMQTLANGIKLYTIEDRKLPMVSVFLGMPNGAYTDPAGAPGTANFAMNMMTRGTATMTAEELAEELESLAISIGGDAGMDSISVSGSALTEHAPRMFELLADSLRRPAFAKKEFDLMMEQEKSGRSVSEQNIDELASRKMRELLWGDHPYRRSAEGTLKDLDKITLAGAKAWYESAVRPEGATLFITGDISPAEAKALADKAFGDWSASAPAPNVALAEPPPVQEKMRVVLMDMPGKNQAQIRAGYLGPKRGAQHYFDLLTFNYLFGGGFSSRLNWAIRQEKGLTYGAGGGFGATRFGGRLNIETFSKNESVVETVKTIIEVIEGVRTNPPNEEEVTKARNFLLGSFAMGRQSTASRVADSWLQELEGLPEDYFQQYLDGIANATPESIKAATDRWLSKDKLTILVVGEAKALKEPLEKAFGTVEVLKP